MKITPNDLSGALKNVDGKKTNGVDTVSNSKSKKSAFSPVDNTHEKLDLSENARLMQKAKDIATNAPDVNEARVAQLQKLIDEGKYKVDAKAVADRLVDDHLLFES